MSTEITKHESSGQELYRTSTDAAGLCREIVLKTAMEIQKRKYVKVEGWQAIAIAHGCTASSRDVEVVAGGVRAIGEIRRMSDGQIIAQAEGFVGEDEPTWYGGEIVTKWGQKTLPKRPDYAIRAMAQTRAISRACRSAFAHVVVLIDANLSTTPAEEVPAEGFADVVTTTTTPPPAPVKPAPESAPAPSLEEQRQKARAFCLARGLPVTDDELEAARDEDALRDLCRRKPVEKKVVECCDFVKPAEHAGSTIGNPYR